MPDLDQMAPGPRRDPDVVAPGLGPDLNQVPPGPGPDLDHVAMKSWARPRPSGLDQLVRATQTASWLDC